MPNAKPVLGFTPHGENGFTADADSRLPDTISVVGTREPLFHQEINAQIDQAFANVDLNLKDGGGEGWELVFRLNLYHVPINDSALEAEGVEF
ncbi:hypothetical protein PENPOL_c005G02666 [Penicillium polonicum]|uniref:Uncharacterized protein n=1 Tax=Penicillium polonicum TaxID=60169 RepID=A0A1V6NMR4_PENPO|nr:hypothetical protein PENPOL_c005G02666 [Penicillium polonicum]